MKDLRLIEFVTLLLFGSSILLWTGCIDKCRDKTCLNGGSCDGGTGTCDCPTGYYGSNCEYEDPVPGYNCINDNCVSVSDNAEYLSFSDCDDNCGSGIAGFSCIDGFCDLVGNNAEYLTGTDCVLAGACVGGTGGYNCSGGDCVFVETNAQYSSISDCENACR